MIAHRSQAGSRRLGWVKAASIVFALACFASAPAWTQTWTGVDGNTWFDAGNWVPGVPNCGCAAVSILDATNNPVQLNESTAVGTLALGATNSLSFDLGTAMYVYEGAIVNAGAITINAGSGNNSVLQLQASTLLSGGGTLTLNSGDNNGQGYIQQGVGGVTLTNQDNTIQGYGVIGNGGIALNNESAGTIDANSSGNSFILDGSGGITNAGLMEATGGGNLAVNNQAISNAGGNITANGGSVSFAGTVIQGGTLNTLNGGTLGINGNSATLDGTTNGAITISTGSQWTAGLNATTYTNGSIINNGNIALTAGSGYNNAFSLLANTTLSGGGTVTLNSGDDNGQAYIEQATGGVTLTNQDNTIQGYGVIGNGGLTLINESGGTIDANVSGQSLTLDNSGGVTNQGLLEATNGGTLNIAGITVNNFGANITANGGNVLVYGSADIEGGTLNAINSGTIGQGNGTAVYLDGTTEGALTISTGTTWNTGLNSTLYTLGSIINNGGISLTAGSGYNTVLALNTNTSLSGGGMVTLNSGDNHGQAYIDQEYGGLTLTNVDNTIQGYGVIGNGGLTLINESGGTIDANVSGQTLTLDNSGGVTNTGTLEATNGGILNINGITVNDAGSGLTANGGTVLINGGSAIDGGFLTNTGGGTIGDGNGVAYLNGETSAGAITLTSGSTWTGGLGSTTYTYGSIINNGNISLSAGSGSNTYLALVDNTTLSGGGKLTLNSGDNNGQVYIEQLYGGLTLTNVDNTIQGYGVIGNGGLAVTNESGGTINANVSNETLTLDNTGGIANTGLLEGTNGGTLNIYGITVNNNGGNITANGGAVLINASTEIDGGTLNSLNGGTLGDGSGVAYLNGGSSAGAVTLSTGSTWTGGVGSTTYTYGSIVNNGNIQLNAGYGGNTYMDLLGSTTLSGGGTVTLNSGDNNGDAHIVQNSGGLTLTNVDNTIQGYGVIGASGLAVNNESAGTINGNATGETLTLNGSGGVTNTGLIEGTNGGTLNIYGITVNNAGGNITANGGAVLINGAAEIDGGTLNTLNGGTMGTGNGSTAYLNGGTSAGAVNISTGSTWTVGLNSTTYVNSSIANGGNIQLNAGYGYNTYLNLLGDTTLSGGGTVTLNSGDNNGVAFIEQNSGGITLTNSDNTIQGYGVIGNGGLTVINGANGTILANSVGNSLIINTSGNVTNNGTMQANAGSNLTVSSNLTNFSGGTLTGGTYVANGTSSTGAALYFNLGSNTGGEILTNAATIAISGPASGIFDRNSNNALSALNSNTGSLTLTNGQALTTSAATLLNTGSVTVGGAGSSLTAGGYSQTGGTTLVDGTLVATGGSASVTGGTISGTGSLGTDLHPLTLNIAGAGVLNPGDSGIGTITINGNYAQLDGGTLLEDIAGTPGSDQYGVTDVTGSVTLGSTSVLDVDLLDGFTPAANTEYSYTILDPFSISGTFGTVDCVVPNGDTCEVIYNYSLDDIVLDINGPEEGPPPVPEPGTFPLLLTGLASVAAGIKARKGRRAA